MSLNAKNDLTLLELPIEILTDILSRLNIRGSLDAELVCTTSLSVANGKAFWWRQVRRYFPHVEAEDPNAFNNEPLLLFRREYNHCLDKIKLHPEYDKMKTVVLKFLSGDLQDFIDPNLHLSSDAVRMLCHLAAANGHHQAVALLYSPQFMEGSSFGWSWEMKFAKLDPTQQIPWMIDGTEFSNLILASAKGDLEAIDRSPVVAQDHIKRNNLFILAAVCGHESALLRLDDAEKIQALYFSAYLSSCDAFKMIFKKANIVFPDNIIASALLKAIVYGQLKIVQYIFNQCPSFSYNTAWYDFLHSACLYNQNNIVEYFLSKFGSDLTMHLKHELVEAAAMYDNFHAYRFALILLNRFAAETSFHHFQPVLLALLESSCNTYSEDEIPKFLNLMKTYCFRSSIISRELKEALIEAANMLKESAINGKLLEGIIALGTESLAELEVFSPPTLVPNFEQVRRTNHSNDQSDRLEDENQDTHRQDENQQDENQQDENQQDENQQDENQDTYQNPTHRTRKPGHSSKNTYRTPRHSSKSYS